MNILVASPTPDALTGFLDGLVAAGHVVHVVPTAAEAIKAVTETPPGLCVVDAGLPDMEPFKLVARLMQINALVFTAVVSDLSEADFHEAGEGLGILLHLPPGPGLADATKLCEALAAVS